MDNVSLALDFSIDANHPGTEHDATVLLKGFNPDDEIGDSSFIFDRDEHHPLAEPGR